MHIRLLNSIYFLIEASPFLFRSARRAKSRGPRPPVTRIETRRSRSGPQRSATLRNMTQPSHISISAPIVSPRRQDSPIHSLSYVPFPGYCLTSPIRVLTVRTRHHAGCHDGCFRRPACFRVPHPVVRFVLFPCHSLLTSDVRLCPPTHIGPRHRNININGRWLEPRSSQASCIRIKLGLSVPRLLSISFRAVVEFQDKRRLRDMSGWSDRCGDTTAGHTPYTLRCI